MAETPCKSWFETGECAKGDSCDFLHLAEFGKVVKPMFYCEICMERLDMDFLFAVSQAGACEHMFCMIDIVNHFHSKIESGQIRGIKCPHDGCNFTYSNPQICSVVDMKYHDQFIKIEQDLLDQEIELA